jgi:hypothetical protein
LSDIAKGILGGGWSLIAGWILPTAINLILLFTLILPSMHGIKIADTIRHDSVTEGSLVLLAASVVIGLTLNALQTPLYRVLEGYLLWPPGLARLRRKHHLSAKAALAVRIKILPHHTREDENLLAPSGRTPRMRLGVEVVAFFRQEDQNRTAVQRALLRERLRRYPVDDEQVAPTRLGNAIRRLEEYGYQRYRLDSQTLWYQLAGAAPKQLRDQVDVARTGVDFFVCLLYGNMLVACAALCATSVPGANNFALLLSALGLVATSLLWYRLAVVTTDDWAAATRALVDEGRETLADAVGLVIPQELDSERKMWQAYSRFVRRPFKQQESKQLDTFRKVTPSDEIEGNGKVSALSISNVLRWFTRKE